MSNADTLPLSAAEAWDRYDEIKSGRRLEDLDEETLLLAIEAHEAYLEAANRAAESIVVRSVRTESILRALGEANFGREVQLETAAGVVVIQGASVHGRRAAVRALGESVLELAEESYRSRADMAEREVPEAWVARWIAGAEAVGRRLLEA